jgi:hypothetical protein
MDPTNKKIADFLGLLEKRTIDAIDGNIKIKESCTATLLLIFAVIDSLSKITCTDAEYIQFRHKKGNKVRFTNFLGNLLGRSYGKFKDQLYDLRNDIVHTGINAKVVLSKDKHAYHLQEVDGELWINTSQFLEDLKGTVKQIRQNIEAQGTYYQNAANRLQDFSIIDVDQSPPPSPSPGPAGALFR